MISVKSFARRLSAGTDFRLGVEEMVEHYQIAAGALMSATGLLSQVEIMTSGGDVYTAVGSYIIKSCTGTAALDKVQLQLELTTQTGDTLKGEMLEGCIVADSVEFVVGAIESSTRS